MLLTSDMEQPSVGPSANGSLSSGRQLGHGLGLSARPQRAKLIVSDKVGRKRVQLSPGLFEETLLKKGSFAFSAKSVHFDRLKVLGNVYANSVNGRPLRETYLLKKTPARERKKTPPPPPGKSATGASLGSLSRQSASGAGAVKQVSKRRREQEIRLQVLER